MPIDVQYNLPQAERYKCSANHCSKFAKQLKAVLLFQISEQRKEISAKFRPLSSLSELLLPVVDMYRPRVH